ncbi:Gag-Pol polyprotein [Labeo rohita]|uniref:ribonuclease H n=1 Tax=Labeo rohita TaxID=84645 RepID=A0ABQ8MHW7_LABRO|nr:Gag-Pol polyprotein [Labeo rohita]
MNCFESQVESDALKDKLAFLGCVCPACHGNPAGLPGQGIKRSAQGCSQSRAAAGTAFCNRLLSRATKVTAQALGRAMSTLMVQERHLWLNLTEMRDAKKVRFLDAPISQVGHFSDTMEEFLSSSPRTAQAPQQVGPAGRPAQRSSSCRKVAPPGRPQATRKLPLRLQSVPETGSPEERDQLTCQDPHSTRGRALDSAPSRLYKRAISFFSVPYSQRSWPSTGRSDAVFSNQNMSWYTSCVPSCSETSNSFRRSSGHERSFDRFLPNEFSKQNFSSPATGYFVPTSHNPPTPGPFELATQFNLQDVRPSTVAFTSVQGENATVLWAEIAVLLAKDAIEPVPSAEIKQWFYSPREGVQDWFVAIDLKNTYFHVSILPRHRLFLRFAFEGRAYQYKVLPFGLSLSPRVFTKVVEAAHAPLREGCRSQPSSLIGTLGQQGKEQTLPSTEYIFPRLSEYDCTSFPRQCTVSAEVCKSTQIQNSGSPEIFPEAPGAHGILSRSHTTGLDAYKTAAALASYPSPEMGMPELPLEQASRRTVVTTNASKTGWGAVRNGVYPRSKLNIMPMNCMDQTGLSRDKSKWSPRESHLIGYKNVVDPPSPSCLQNSVSERIVPKV